MNMKFLILLLIIISFLQTTIFPMDLVLLILVLRAYIVSKQQDLYLAFGFGILVSHLTLIPLGVHSIIYLLGILLAHASHNSRLSQHILTVLPLVLTVLLVDEVVTSKFLHQSLQIWPQVILISLLSLPGFWLIKYWEERFVVKDIKLRI